MEKYELAVQNVKATLFDTVYREQGIVDILTKRLQTFNPEDQQRLMTIFTKQKEDIEKIISLLDDVGVKYSEILENSKEIMNITNGNSQVASQAPVAEVTATNDVDSAKDDVVSVVVDKPVDESTAVITPVETEKVTSDVISNVGGDQVVAPVSAEAGVVTGSEVVSQPVIETPQQETPVVNQSEPVIVSNEEQNVMTNTENAENAPALVPEVSTPTVTESAPIEGAVASAETVTNDGSNLESGASQEVPVVPPVENVPATDNAKAEEMQTATTEVVQIPGQTGPIEDEPVSSTSDASEVTSDFVLSPIDEGIAPTPPAEEVPVAQEQASDDGIKQDIIPDASSTTETQSEELPKYTRTTTGTVKAILVTKVQHEKLSASRSTQKALLNAQQDGNEAVDNNAPVADVASAAPVADASAVVETPVSTTESTPVQSDEQTLISNGLLEPTVQDKQKEMQVMMEQANTLYNEGKTQEAQALFDKVSAMNKELQAGSEGQALVKS